jgi:hypothetical protein
MEEVIQQPKEERWFDTTDSDKSATIILLGIFLMFFVWVITPYIYLKLSAHEDALLGAFVSWWFGLVAGLIYFPIFHLLNKFNLINPKDSLVSIARYIFLPLTLFVFSGEFVFLYFIVGIPK